MELGMIAAILFGSAALVYLYSFTQKEEKEQAYIELEEFSLAVTQSVFELNERVKTLESEHEIDAEVKTLQKQVTQLNKDNIITLFTKGCHNRGHLRSAGDCFRFGPGNH
ncbi:MAG: hypothetical protein U5K84_11585 [Alkalibacterium sp.]|nr:hypothetical protein [Alkalibacterium sp.]